MQQTQQTTTSLDGTSNSISDTEASTYDNYGRPTQTTSTSNSGGSSPTTLVHTTSYVWNDGLTVPAAQRSNASQEAAWGGTYLITATASTGTEDSLGNQYACQRNSYDGRPTRPGRPARSRRRTRRRRISTLSLAEPTPTASSAQRSPTIATAILFLRRIPRRTTGIRVTWARQAQPVPM